MDLVRADDPAGFALKVLSLGLLGVTVGERIELKTVSKSETTAAVVPPESSQGQTRENQIGVTQIWYKNEGPSFCVNHSGA